MKTGIQISSFRPVLTTEAEVRTAFERLAAMGCGTVQLQWIDPSVPAAFIRDAMEQNGVESVSVQDFYQTVLRDRSYYETLNGLTGGTWICVSRIPERLKSREGLDAYVRELRELAASLEERGQKLCFHPVSGDFQPIGDLDPVGYLLERMPELELCADLYHLHKSGKDLKGWLERYAGRVCMVHFKDFRRDEGGNEALVPAGQGEIDWTGVAKACRDTGVRYAFVEQERWEGDPFERLREAFDWLNGQL